MWLLGQRLFGAVADRAKKITVHDALVENRWISDIRGTLTINVLIEYLRLWEKLSGFELQAEVDDTHIWQFSASGHYSAKTAYEALITRAVQFKPRKRIWKSWAPGKYKFFMWTVAHKKYWTVDHLAKKRTSTPSSLSSLRPG